MKDSEFNERFPMVVALHESTELFNKKKYDNAIEILENVLKKDPSTDFTTTIRRDIWFNLSVLYVLKGQFDKVLEGLSEYIKYKDKMASKIFSQVPIPRGQLTPSQVKALGGNYKFNNYSYFLKSSKYKKSFNLFLAELESVFTEIELLVKKEEFLDAYERLIFFMDIIIHSNFSAVDIYRRQLTFENKDLYNLLTKAEKLVDLCKSKISEIHKNTLLYQLKNIETLIDQGQITTAKEKLNSILNQNYNMVKGKDISGKKEVVNRILEEMIFESDEIFKKAKELLEICKVKEKFIKEKGLKDKLLEIEELVKKEKFIKEKGLKDKLLEIEELVKKEKISNAVIELDNLIKEAKSSGFNDISKRAVEERKKVTQLEEFSNQFEDFKKEFGSIENAINEYNKDLINYSKDIINIQDMIKFFNKRSVLRNKILAIFHQFKDNNYIKEKGIKFVLQYYSPYFEIDPFDMDKQFLPHFLGQEKVEITPFLKNLVSNQGQDYLELNDLYNNLIKRLDSLKLQSVKKESEKIREIKFKIPVENLYNFLLDFSEVLPLGLGVDSKTDDSTETDYTIKTHFGRLNFKIAEKQINKRIIYEYDFLESDVKEKGKFYLDFINLGGGQVNLKVRNEIDESNDETGTYNNWLGNYLKQWIDYSMGKIVAEQVHTIFYEKSFDDLTMGNYKILQAKINTMGKNIENLKNKFFEVKAPLTLTSFDCSECGATLNITSNEEKFIICEHCDTPFLMEWQSV